MNRRNILVYYDDCCAPCEKVVLHLNTTDNLRFVGFSTMEPRVLLRGTFCDGKKVILRDSIVYVNGDIVKFKSDAVLAVVSDLGGVYGLFKVLYLIPKILRDMVYDLVAKNRHRYFK